MHLWLAFIAGICILAAIILVDCTAPESRVRRIAWSLLGIGMATLVAVIIWMIFTT